MSSQRSPGTCSPSSGASARGYSTRLPTGAILTDAGQRLVPYAEQIMELEDRMCAEVPTDTGQPAGPVRLTAPESLCAYRLPALLAALRAEEPDLRLSVNPGGTAAALQAVRDRTTDLALMLEPMLTAADVLLESVGTEDLVLLTGTPSAATKQSWTWDDLAAGEALLLEEGCSYSDDTARHLLAAGQPATRRTHFGSIEAIKQCVAAGLGWTVLPASHRCSRTSSTHPHRRARPRARRLHRLPGDPPQPHPRTRGPPRARPSPQSLGSRRVAGSSTRQLPRMSNQTLTDDSRAEAYQRPFALATSICARPERRMRPLTIRRSASLLLRADQVDLGLLGW